MSQSPWPPERIGRYAVTGRVGSGGFATVLRATDEVLQSVVAIKVLAANWARESDMRDRFIVEARLLRRADSDRVVRVHDIGDLPDGRPYFVMTFADRGTLAQRIEATPMPWRVATSVVAEIARGLQVLHDAGILHRDVKPSNVLFRSLPGGREQLVLGDLGLGKLLGQSSGMTMVGGTPGFMAPEQGFTGVPLGVRTDVYGAGAVLYRALTGRSPHDPDVVIYPATTHPAVPPSTLVAGVPPELDHIVLRAIAHDPQRRHPDATALLADLDRVLTGPPGHRPPAAPPRTPTAVMPPPPATPPAAHPAGARSTPNPAHHAVARPTPGQPVAGRSAPVGSAGHASPAAATPPPAGPKPTALMPSRPQGPYASPVSSAPHNSAGSHPPPLPQGTPAQPGPQAVQAQSSGPAEPAAPSTPPPYVPEYVPPYAP